VREDALPNPRSPYAVSKLAAEYYVKTIGGLWGIETLCLRVFNAYGPGQNFPPVHAPVVLAFLRQALNNGTLVVHGDGNQTRDYIYVDDAVNAMLAASTAPEVNQLTINVGSGRETSVRDLAKLVISVTGANPEVVYNPRSDRGTSRLCADLTLAANKLNFKPSIPLETGLRLTLERDSRLRLR